ncbi:pyroglutamyl-peptidase I [Metasolibacillus meyeri]|uniref:Pyrrolidone-carboxylate peptidase n=1 Tax=Metasolibacillus meyeri TaxID=1071052 RepID=A0AAW9NR80_9BACL|nr:pyroglutamyl-peptidase I [Metasolibacillus meyeri]MEC1177363.1 pyroglutamyl-peptidase I [Metasolibacillus meyeri]
MKKLLVTGFEPFLHFTLNPTAEVAAALDGETIGQYQIVSKVLPVEFVAAQKHIRALLIEEKPDAVIALGLAGGRSKITPERIAINVMDGPKDNSGHTPIDEVIAEDGADGYFSTLPIRAMVNRLKEAGYPAAISNTAGAYVCNLVMYTLLHETKGTIPAGFIHIPASHHLAIEEGKVPSWSQADLNAAIKLCIETLV